MAEQEQKSKRSKQRHSWFIQRQVALEYLKGNKSLRELSSVYNIPNQTISRWALSYGGSLEERKTYFDAMTTEEQKQYDTLKQENERLKKELEFTQMKTVAMETIIDLAKEELGIDLRKNSGAKQPVKSNTTTRRQK